MRPTTLTARYSNLFNDVSVMQFSFFLRGGEYSMSCKASLICSLVLSRACSGSGPVFVHLILSELFRGTHGAARVCAVSREDNVQRCEVLIDHTWRHKWLLDSCWKPEVGWHVCAMCDVGSSVLVLECVCVCACVCVCVPVCNLV